MNRFFRFSNYSLLLFALLFPVLKINAQCCSVGSPLGASSYGGVVAKNSLRVSSFIRYSQSDDYYSGSKKQPDYGLLSYNDFLFQGLTLAYGVTKKINIETEFGYFYHKTQYYKTEDPFPQTIIKGKGMSNGVISVKYALYKSLSKAFEATAGAGLKFPFSTKPMYVDNALLPEDIQPSTSAYGWMAQLVMQKEFKPQKITLFLYNRYEQNTKNDNNYLYGNRYRVSFIVSKKIKKNFGAIVQVRYENIGQDISNGAKQINTGADLIFVSPQVLYSLKSKWNFILGAELPLYKNYKGTQMSNNYAVSLTLTRDINLNKKPAAASN
jgi:hypothetical protein